MWSRKNDVSSPKIGSPITDHFSATTRYSACGDVKMIYAPPKLDPQCTANTYSESRVEKLFFTSNYSF